MINYENYINFKIHSYSKQSISKEDVDSVIKILNSDYLTQGPIVPMFEKAVAEKTDAKYGVAVNSATSALHLACLSIGIGEGDVVWTSPNTFVSSANCALFCGANVSFVDIDDTTGNICVKELEKKLVQAHKHNRIPKAIIPVHFGGQPTNQELIWNLAQEYGVKIIEDASHSLGAQRNGNKVGNCKYSDITVFSFHPVKIITTAEGGMAMTNDNIIANKMIRLRSHGISKNRDDYVNKDKDAPWYYEQTHLGFNYRMSDLQASLGLSQIRRLDEFVSKRNLLANRYNKYINFKSNKPLSINKGNLSSRHIYVIYVSEDIHRSVFEDLREYGIGVNLHYIPVHLQPFYQSKGFKKGDYPFAELHAKKAISLPIYPNLNFQDQDYIIEVFNKLSK